jgi:outer membrane protein OmpA-like peptidoglycan-associated protein
VKKDIALFPSNRGNVRLLVYFDYNKDDLKSESIPELNRLVDFLKAHPDVRGEIAGHTDSVGSAPFNQTLSKNRAEAVRRYLLNKSVEAARLEARGYGEDQPVDDNGTEDGRARNRRVEFRVKE